VVAANRDEFYARDTQEASFWADSPDVLAGRDLEGGGTWMGVTRTGRFAALTNYRDPALVRSGTPTRGRLVADFLCGEMGTDAYQASLLKRADIYSPYNLVFGMPDDLRCFSNVDGVVRRLEPGIWGLSNHLLNTKWPKVYRVGKAMEEALGGEEDGLESRLFEALADRKIAPDRLLPDTGVGLLMERSLSPPFVHIPSTGYGTRSSTLLTVGDLGGVRLVERTFGAEGEFSGEGVHTFVVAH